MTTSLSLFSIFSKSSSHSEILEKIEMIYLVFSKSIFPLAINHEHIRRLFSAGVYFGNETR
jgi:hypothetical protein